MIEIRYSSGEVDLSGTPEDLRNVWQSILSLLQSKEKQVLIPVAIDFDPAPYNCSLSSLSIRKSNASIKVAVSSNSLEVQGEPEKLATFAKWFNFEDEVWSGYHCHFDYYEGNQWIASDSIPLIISVK